MTTLNVADSFVLAAGSKLAFANETGIALLPGASGPADVLRIAGTLEVTYDLSAGVNQAVGISAPNLLSNPDAVVTIEPTGKVTVVSTAGGEGGQAIGFAALDSYAPDLRNHGAMQVSSPGFAVGVQAMSQGPWTFENTGSLTVSSSLVNAYGVALISSGTCRNSGTITVSAKTLALGVGINSFQSASFENSGVIVARGGDDVNTCGVYWRIQATPGSFPPHNSFTNTGRIEGPYALRVVDEFPGNHLTDLFTNSGALIGKVDLGGGASRLANSGLIQGEVALGGGADTYSGADGLTVGMVSGGDGDDSLQGSAGFDNFQGNIGGDTEAGGAGDDWVVGGKDGDVLFGDAGGDLVYGNLGADTCEGGDGNDIVRGGQDGDIVRGGNGDDFVSGDKGDDTMTGGAGADVFHTFGDAGIDRVLDFSLTQGDRVQLDPGTQFSVSPSGADTVINMTGGAQMILVGVSMSTLTGNWIFGA